MQDIHNSNRMLISPLLFRCEFTADQSAAFNVRTNTLHAIQTDAEDATLEKEKKT
eukprot:m.148791 g.148791  ORF g.148791 m.148791 type:complete len:55 (+) comp16143_c0_seq1:338-502(+)